MAGECQPGIEDIVRRDRCPELVDRLIAQVDHRRGLGFGGEGDRDHPYILAMCAGDLDQGLVVLARHHLELAIGKALAALGALKPTCLSAKDIEHVVHAISLPPPPKRQTKQI